MVNRGGGAGPSSPERAPAAIKILTMAVGGLGAALMVCAARGDLWLDEIWSLSFASAAGSLADIVFKFRHDNNHVLNTMYLHLMGENRPLLLYRLLAVSSGMGSLILIAVIARRTWGWAEAFMAVVLSGSSAPLLLYFSEARGYGPVIFFSLAAYFAHWRGRSGSGGWWLAIFWACSVLGVLAHSTFVMVSLALAATHLAGLAQKQAAPRRLLAQVTLHHAPVLLFFVGWYLVYIRGFSIGGGGVFSTSQVVGRACAMLIGMPDDPALAPLAMLLVAGILVLGTLLMRRDGDPRWTFFPALLVLSPAAILLVRQPTFLYFRYFLVLFPFFYLLLGRTLCLCSRAASPGLRRIIIPAALLLLIMGHTPGIHGLLRYGRGDYQAALARIAQSAGDRRARVGSDHDFRNSMLFDFYVPRNGLEGAIEYVTQPRWRDAPVDWYIMHSQQRDPPVRQVIKMRGGALFRLEGSYPFSAISGWHWFLYRRVQGQQAISTPP